MTPPAAYNPLAYLSAQQLQDAIAQADSLIGEVESVLSKPTHTDRARTRLAQELDRTRATRARLQTEYNGRIQ